MKREVIEKESELKGKDKDNEADREDVIKALDLAFRITGLGFKLGKQ